MLNLHNLPDDWGAKCIIKAPPSISPCVTHVLSVLAFQVLLTSLCPLQRPTRLVFTDVANSINAWGGLGTMQWHRRLLNCVTVTLSAVCVITPPPSPEEKGVTRVTPEGRGGFCFSIPGGCWIHLELLESQIPVSTFGLWPHLPYVWEEDYIEEDYIHPGIAASWPESVLYVRRDTKRWLSCNILP